MTTLYCKACGLPQPPIEDLATYDLKPCAQCGSTTWFTDSGVHIVPTVIDPLDPLKPYALTRDDRLVLRMFCIDPDR